MSEVLKAELRTAHGKRDVRRLRRAGKVPGILYGHQLENVSLSFSADEVGRVVRHGTRVVDLQGAVQEKAVLRELQWDAFGNAVVHLDLERVSADEKVQVELSVELRGEAPGVKEGGVVEFVLHTVEIDCPVDSVPEKLTLSINELALDSSLLASDLELPAGATLVTAADTLLVHCVLPPAEELVAGVGETAEPELIGRKEKEEEEE